MATSKTTVIPRYTAPKTVSQSRVTIISKSVNNLSKSGLDNQDSITKLIVYYLNKGTLITYKGYKSILEERRLVEDKFIQNIQLHEKLYREQLKHLLQ